MQAPASHYLLFTESLGRGCEARRWRFVLQRAGGGERIVAADAEPGADPTRLALLAVVRGLEALDGPARVTLLVAHRFVRRGMCRDLAQWRERGWRWERFGELVPIRDLDLWQRIDRALAIHQVECVSWSADQYASETACLSDHSPNEQFAANSACDEPLVVRPRRRGAGSTYPQRRHGFPARRQLTLWGQEVLNSLSGLGRAALSRTG